MEPIIFINKIMNFCLHLCSECFLGKLKKVVNKFNPFIFLMSHRLSAVQIKVFGTQFMTGNTCNTRNWQCTAVHATYYHVQLYMQQNN